MLRFVRLLLLGSLFFIRPSLLAWGTIRTASNNPSLPLTGTLVYTTLQAAINASQPGDTVYVQPSPVAYSASVLAMRLVILGNGARPLKNLPMGSNVSQLTIDVGGSGSLIAGLGISQLYIGVAGHTTPISDVSIQEDSISSITCFYYSALSNVVFRLNNLGTLTLSSPATNCRIINNVFAGTPSAYIDFAATGSTGDTIAGNVMFSRNTSGRVLDCASPVVIANNVFVSATGSLSKAFGSVSGCTIENNVFYGVGTGVYNIGPLQGNAFLNNISYGNSDDALPPVGTGTGNSGSGNLVGTNPGFLSAPTVGVDTFDRRDDFHRTGSQKGTDGMEIGVYGGIYPFPSSYSFLTGSFLPVVQLFDLSNIIRTGDSVRISVRGAGQ